MVMNDRPSKRAKRITADLHDFLTFPAAVADYGDGSFRCNVRRFLTRQAREAFTPSLFPCLVSWQILFRIGDAIIDAVDSPPPVVALDVVEEDVTRSRSVHCDQCRVVGWSNHPVCSKRYHFIIRAVTDPYDAYQKCCSRCGNLLHLLDSRCKSCGLEITADDLEDWLYLQFEDTTHLLHGVVHSNGYGHLLRVNGREGGSRILSGCDIMSFWDRLCNLLAVRKVSVMDVSKKYGLEYRLLHATIKGHSWYGDWGYEFGSGSYALTRDAYKKAVDTVSNAPLSFYLSQGRKPRSQLQEVIAFYQSLSDTQLVTLKDLFCFLLRLIHEGRKSILPKTHSKASPAGTSNVLCVWTRNEVERVQKAMIKVLLAAAVDSSWVSRRALKGALCKAASLELLDYCLKHLGGKLAGNGMVVHARCNPTSNVVEFRVEPENSMLHGTAVNTNRPSEEHIIRDLKILYDCVLYPDTMVSYRPPAARQLIVDSAVKLLDCKQFVKDYKPDRNAVSNPFVIQFWCHMELAEHPKEEPAPPPELIVLSPSATVADLKLEATKAFQEVYPVFKRFEAEDLLDYGRVDDSMTLKVLIGSSGSVRVRGRCPGVQALNCFRMERGTENWTVDCMCGAKDDDGERMLACDTCGVWLHTRCAGVDRFDVIPAKFVCARCLNAHHEASNSVTPIGEEAGRVACKTNYCRNESASKGSGLGNRLALTFDIR